MDQKIIFSQLSWQNKVGIVGGWAVLIIYAFAFIYGFFAAMAGV